MRGGSWGVMKNVPLVVGEQLDSSKQHDDGDQCLVGSGWLVDASASGGRNIVIATFHDGTSGHSGPLAIILYIDVIQSHTLLLVCISNHTIIHTMHFLYAP